MVMFVKKVYYRAVSVNVRIRVWARIGVWVRIGVRVGVLVGVSFIMNIVCISKSLVVGPDKKTI
jgi:hypothetical protein